MADKKMNNFPAVTDLNYVYGELEDGSQVKIKKSDLASVVAGLIPGTDDNVFIVYHRKGDGYILAARMCEWPTLQAEGNVADGVMVCGGTKSVIVAPTEAAETMPLCKSAVLGRREIGEKKWAMADWDGKENTAEQVKHPECSGTGYAPGFCHAYSRMNPDNNGYGAGEWWLPSLAEMILIYQHFDLVNKALSMINGATQLITSWYWSSTEYAKDTKWNIGFGLGDLIGRGDGVEGLLRVRPVTSMVENVPISSKDVGRIYGELDRGEKVKISKADLASIVAGLLPTKRFKQIDRMKSSINTGISANAGYLDPKAYTVLVSTNYSDGDSTSYYYGILRTGMLSGDHATLYKISGNMSVTCSVSPSHEVVLNVPNTDCFAMITG